MRKSALHSRPFGRTGSCGAGTEASRAGGKNARSEPWCLARVGRLVHIVVSGEVYEPLRTNHKVVSAVA